MVDNFALPSGQEATGFVIGVIVTMVTIAAIHFVSSYYFSLCIPLPSFFPRIWKQRKRTRVYVDGCFDLMHFGHANAIRQAKSLGDELVVGVVSDDEIFANKGPPVMKLAERLIMISAVKWVDEVIPNVPYCLTESFLQTLFSVHKIDFVVHGDDPCLLPDGSDAYYLPKKLGKYKQIKRTEGVSSTDIVGRILSQDEDKSVESRMSHFLPTSRRIVQFANNKPIPEGAQIVYVDGSFDLFHCGHVEVLKAAKEHGDFLLVGIHPDNTVANGRPLLSVLERSLSVMSCRYTDDVIIGAPFTITKDLIVTFNISVVVGFDWEYPGSDDRFAAAKAMDKFRALSLPESMTTKSILGRILQNQEVFQERNQKKKEKENAYYSQKAYLSDL